jgi:hypothetical protein
MSMQVESIEVHIYLGSIVFRTAACNTWICSIGCIVSFIRTNRTHRIRNGIQCRLYQTYISTSCSTSGIWCVVRFNQMKHISVWLQKYPERSTARTSKSRYRIEWRWRLDCRIATASTIVTIFSTRYHLYIVGNAWWRWRWQCYWYIWCNIEICGSRCW